MFLNQTPKPPYVCPSSVLETSSTNKSSTETTVKKSTIQQIVNQPITTVQSHVHEFENSTKLAEECDDRHNHRVAGVTSEVILQTETTHVHAIVSNTDFLDHHHEIAVVTGINQEVGGGKHIHLIAGITTFDDDHVHEFLFTTQIQSPLV